MMQVRVVGVVDPTGIPLVLEPPPQIHPKVPKRNPSGWKGMWKGRRNVPEQRRVFSKSIRPLVAGDTYVRRNPTERDDFMTTMDADKEPKDFSK